MRDIRYTLLDPTGNRTVLVETPVDVRSQVPVAGQIMDAEPDAEQVGFLSARPDGVSLRMAGGEFCGNAAMSAAVLYAADRGIASGAVPVDVWGTPVPVTVEVEALPDGSVRGTLSMPRPVSVGKERFPDGICRPVVRFPGISHVILEGTTDREAAEAAAPAWCGFLGSECVGLMLYDREGETLRPLVYVPSAGTMFWENSCASGTAAVGAYLAAKDGPVSLSLRQPGGTLHIEADAEGGLFLTGAVRICRRRTIRVRDGRYE